MRYFLLALLFLAAPALAEWHEGTPLPTSLADVRGVLLNNQIYVMDATDGASFFESYDVKNDSWRPLTPLPASIKHFSLAADAGRIYLSGGAEVAGDVWVYAPDVAIWVRRARLPRPRAGHASAVVNGKLFLLGGIAATNHIDSYDIRKGTWQQIAAPMPEPVARASVTIWGDEIVLAGGINQQGRDTAAVQAFNTKTNKWRRLAALPQPASGVGLASFKNTLHIFGGYAQTSQKVLDTHFILQKNKWQPAPPMPEARHQMTTAAAHNKIVLIGGALGGGFYAHFTASDRVLRFTP